MQTVGLLGSIWGWFGLAGGVLLGLLALIFGLLLYRRKAGNETLTEIDLSPDKPNRTKATIKKKGFLFAPFRIKGNGVALKEAGLAADEELMIVERGGERHAFALRELAYHHVAQGELAGQPYLVSF